MITPSDLSLLLDDLDLTEADDRLALAEWAATHALSHLDLTGIPDGLGLTIVEQVVAALSAIDLRRDPVKVAERQKRRALRRAMRAGDGVQMAASLLSELPMSPAQATALRLLVSEAVNAR